MKTLRGPKKKEQNEVKQKRMLNWFQQSWLRFIKIIQSNGYTHSLHYQYPIRNQCAQFFFVSLFLLIIKMKSNDANENVIETFHSTTNLINWIHGRTEIKNVNKNTYAVIVCEMDWVKEKHLLKIINFGLTILLHPLRLSFNQK